MADAYWRYSEAMQATLPAAAPPAAASPPSSLKRPRPDYPDAPGRPEMAGYYSRDEERTGYHHVTDTEALNASYDHYLRTGMASYGLGESARPVALGTAGYQVDDRHMMSVRAMDGRNIGYGGARPEPSLPPDASNTLFVEGLPTNCTRREVSHIFRPFVGFREVRLVNKESKILGSDPVVLCFVDFSTAAQAAVALDALQGYVFDEYDRDSANLRLQFARLRGPRGSGGPAGGRSRR